MKKFRLCDVQECSVDVKKYDPSDTREQDFKRRQATLQLKGESPRTLESWSEPPYDILCPLGFHEVSDIRKWKNIQPIYKLHEGLYICQPLVGYFRENGPCSVPAWVLVCRILLGYAAGRFIVRSFGLRGLMAKERAEADCHRLGVPLSVMGKAVEFDRGGVLAVVDNQPNLTDPLGYRVASMNGLHGLGYLHAEFLDFERARLERAGMELEPSLACSAVSAEQANSD